MNFRKTIAGISAVLIAAGPLAAAPMTSFADDKAPETTEQYFTEGKITTHVYDTEKTVETQCRFYPKTPNVPYVSLADYYKTVNMGEEISITKNEKGTYDLKSKLEGEGTIDTDKDVLTTSDIIALCFPLEDAGDDASINNLFVRPVEIEQKGEAHDMVIDFANYDIDLYGEDSDIWFPLPTLCNMFSGFQHRGIYFDKELYYTYDINFSAMEIFTAEGLEDMLSGMSDGRPEDLAVYNYNEICRVFDCDYGFPGSIPLTDAIKEKGLDGALSETNADTKGVKEKLLSTDYATYLTGLIELELYTYDGGHTVMFSGGADMLSEDLFNEVLGKLKENRDYELASNIGAIEFKKQAGYSGAKAARSAVTEETDEQFYRYVVKGDTALFSFDSFMDVDIEGWEAYYGGKGERPEDIISVFYECLKDADANPDVKNFIVDVSTNGGGLVMVDTYMMSLMGGDPVCFNEYRDKGITTVERYGVDKNLDGKIDEEDDKVKFDLNFGVIESAYSFSSANEFPSNAKDAGFMIIGEKSSGGSCAIASYTTPDGYPFFMSWRIKSTNKDGYDIDLGIKPDYELVTINEDGSKDFSKTFDFDVISKCFAEYYKKDSGNQEPAVTTTTTSSKSSETTTTTTAATTAAASESTTASSTSGKAESSTTASTTAQASETTSASTTEATTDTTGELPQTGKNSLTTVAVVFTAISLTAGGAFALSASRKKDEE